MRSADPHIVPSGSHPNFSDPNPRLNDHCDAERISQDLINSFSARPILTRDGKVWDIFTTQRRNKKTGEWEQTYNQAVNRIAKVNLFARYHLMSAGRLTELESHLRTNGWTCSRGPDGHFDWKHPNQGQIRIRRHPIPKSGARIHTVVAVGGLKWSEAGPGLRDEPSKC
jgi:predicted RNA binding protein YcfA (HicA-like mRNA interferase family)